MFPLKRVLRLALLTPLLGNVAYAQSNSTTQRKYLETAPQPD
jgi:hypothetical protein